MIKYTLRAKSLIMNAERWVTFTDFLLDRLNNPVNKNPIIDYISDISGYPIYNVEDSFMYFSAFNDISLTDVSRYLALSSEGFYFWYDLYSISDSTKNSKEGILKILQLVGNYIN